MGVLTLIRLKLALEESVTVGSALSTIGPDRTIARDGDNQPWIPPSGIAGSFRSHLNSVDPELVTRYMGSLDAGPSALRFVHTKFVAPPTDSRRRQTSVDPWRGAARKGSLRSTERIEAGATLIADVSLDGDVSPLEDAFATFAPFIGSGRSAGQGKTRLVEWKTGTLDLTNPSDLKTWLTLGGPSLVDAVATEPRRPSDASSPTIIASHRASVVDGLLIDPQPDCDDSGVLHARSSDHVHGSTLRGIIRSRCRFVLRSLARHQRDTAGVSTKIGETGEADLPEVERLIDELFGSTDSAGCLRFPDAKIEVGDRSDRPHVAIDRITGGSCEGRLFTENVIGQGSFHLSIEKTGDVPPWANPLISSVLADIDEGFVGIGGRTSRGLGTVSLHPSPQRPSQKEMQLVLNALAIDALTLDENTVPANGTTV